MSLGAGGRQGWGTANVLTEMGEEVTTDTIGGKGRRITDEAVPFFLN